MFGSMLSVGRQSDLSRHRCSVDSCDVGDNGQRGARMTFRLVRGGIFARPARIILLATSLHCIQQCIQLGLLYAVFHSAIYELYRVLKRLTLPPEVADFDVDR